MKKLIVILAIVMGLQNAFGQKYFVNINLGASFGKDMNGAPEKEASLEGYGVYAGWFFWQAARKQPLGNPAPEFFKKTTMLTLGVGMDKVIGQTKVRWGGGPSAILTPRIDAIPKKSDILWGVTTIGNIDNEYLNLELEMKGTYVFLPPKNDYDWSLNVFPFELKGIKFFGEYIGIGVGYKAQIITRKERQVPGVQFNQTSNGETTSEATAFLCGKFRWAKIEVGPAIRTIKHTNTGLDSYGNYQKNSNRDTYPTSIEVKLIITLESDGK